MLYGPLFVSAELQIKRFANLQSGLLLQSKDILQVANKIVSPDLKARESVDQLHVHTYLIPGGRSW